MTNLTYLAIGVVLGAVGALALAADIIVREVEAEGKDYWP
jgi:hypothetical protein